MQSALGTMESMEWYKILWYYVLVIFQNFLPMADATALARSLRAFRLALRCSIFMNFHFNFRLAAVTREKW